MIGSPTTRLHAREGRISYEHCFYFSIRKGRVFRPRRSYLGLLGREGRIQSSHKFPYSYADTKHGERVEKVPSRHKIPSCSTPNGVKPRAACLGKDEVGRREAIQKRLSSTRKRAGH
ncbi:hypothetical protein AMTR_s00087p00180310 [Amborella trichopoda]|uniref:Uncharacterized protein n=1 Tax=Amborella trichopoda TaxID=13333 RepID=W1P3V1_AMBTC|nr:hypothetical protein AMTR_s00087p00180310 [Amborella trichopoda]